MSDRTDPLAEAYAEAAARWRTVLASGTPSAQEREAFLAWLRESPRHVEAYLRVAADADALAEAARAWPEDADALVAAARAAPDEPIPFPTAHRSPASPPPRIAPRERRRALAALAAAAAVAAIAVGWTRLGGPGAGSGAAPQEFRTAHAEQGSWPLADGSVLHLNSGSHAIVRYGADERVVELVTGQAMFQVAHDARRRFRVDAGGAHVVAVGTAFDVRREADRNVLVVLEGRVAVLRGAAPRPDAALAGGVPVAAGQRLDLARADAAPVAADLRQAGAWLQREVAFDATPLAEVAREFSRYTAVPIEIEGETLRRLPITGTFGAYDSESFLAFLARLDGIAVAREAGRVRVYARRTEAAAGRP
jgi:transmembrane sensor